MIPILLGVSFITFGLMYLSPNDPAEMMLIAQGVPTSPEVLEKMQIRMGLDKPFLTQYLTWLLNFCKGDLGESYVLGQTVLDMIVAALPVTLKLAFYSCLMTLIFAIPLGVLSAVKQNKFTDYFIRITSFAGVSIPGFFLSLLLIYFFSLKLKWLPVLGAESAKGMILPVATLSVAMICKYIRQIRAAVLEELNKGYVKGARSRGVKESVIVCANVLKNAMLTIITLMVLSAGSLLGGTAIVERIFVIPGLGNMVMDAISARDYPVIQGFVAWMAIIFTVINLLADISYQFLDPRIRWKGKNE